MYAKITGPLIETNGENVGGNNMFKMFKLEKPVKERNWRIEDKENNFTVEFMSTTDAAGWLYTHLSAASPENTKMYCKL